MVGSFVGLVLFGLKTDAKFLSPFCFSGVTGQAPNGPALFNNQEEDWGDRYGGVRTRAECARLPPAAIPGCEWRFDSLQGADNPGVSYKRVKCGFHPNLYEKSGCLLKEDVV